MSLAHLNLRAYEKLMHVGLEKWARSQYSTSSHLVLEQWFNDRLTVAQESDELLTPEASQKISAEISKSRHYTAKRTTARKYRVRAGGRHFMVDLQERSCECNEFNLDSMPEANESVSDYVDTYYKRSSLIDTYSGAFDYMFGTKRLQIAVQNIKIVEEFGGYNYASTNLAALWYRLNEEKAEWIIYVTDVGQREHFEMLFAAAKRAGWLPADGSKYPKASHVGFGLVLGEDGKRFRTRSTETVKLVDLLIEAKSRCKTALIERGKDKEWTEEELDKTAEAVGYGAVK
ncbi:uncharacterized protein LOC131026128 [Salvia miltiorrhiza]|uniref:uncharacterized protein LOC131026128 n=1 Tax=Salvia miltiorrhiza TaxID=226208 RepID=UPI0025AC32E4|nr:uncharacterized protein LOC131026128 [Salvia miltiorrhiza]